MKNKIDRLKELWAVPKYKIYIKFVLWFIFLIFVFLFIIVGNSLENSKQSNKQETKVSNNVNFSKMKNYLITEDLKVKYTIGDYYIEGDISNGILNATLEYEDNIYKIKYDGTNLYQVRKSEEIDENDLLSDINKDYLLPNNIIDKINNTTVTPTKSVDGKIYSYTIDNIALSLYLNDTSIEKIILLDDTLTYELDYLRTRDINETTK